MESFWATFARRFGGVYHHIDKKHLHRYVDEFTRRHNVRNADTIDMMAAQAQNMTGKRLTYDGLIGKTA